LRIQTLALRTNWRKFISIKLKDFESGQLELYIG
jgi:hypothetical protein